MFRNRVAPALVAALLIVSAGTLSADVRSEQKTRVQLAGAIGKVVNLFGGKAAREGVTQTISLKGDRKATINDQTGQIIDLKEEKIYDLDLKKKTYKVTTFADLRRQMEEARKKAAEEARKDQGHEAAQPAKPAQKDPNAKEYEVDFDIKNTGEKKSINGFDTKQAIVTITVHEKGKKIEDTGGVILKSDMWMTPKVAALTELQQFDLRYAQAVYGSTVIGASPQDMATAMAMYPQMKPALDKMKAEGGKIDGTAILTTVTLDAVQSPEQAAQQQKSGGSQPTSIGGMIGGFGKKIGKKDDVKKDEAPKGSTTFLTSTVEVLKLGTDVPADALAIPAGFKEEK
jgi:hypothetical protein